MQIVLDNGLTASAGFAYSPIRVFANMVSQPSPEATADFLIVGAGIAAASVGFWLARHGRVTLLEREEQPGYHATGRSAAIFIENYGSPQVRALTLASRAFFERPPEGFSDQPILTRRGALLVAASTQVAMLEEQWGGMASASRPGQRLDRSQTCAMVPVLRPEKVLGSLYEPDAADMDVHALHQGFLKGVTQLGGQVVCNAEVTALTRSGGRWCVQAGGNSFQAPVVINAAGAWCDEIARLAGAQTIGLVPKRRSAFVFAPPADVDTRGWPMFIGLDHSWFVKPEAGMLLGSPANEDPVTPHDVQPEEIDIATGAFRIEEMTTLQIRRPLRSFAGLRSFVADGDLVGGFDPDLPGFFWLAAQGGYGIQTSAAMGEACAALARGMDMPPHLAAFGLSAAMLAPSRLRHRSDL